MYDTPRYNQLKIIGIQDILFPNHGFHKGIKSTNIQRKKHKNKKTLF
jgi:pectin methylesterase-like acyl-CoA thioesterase